MTGYWTDVHRDVLRFIRTRNSDAEAVSVRR